MIAKLISGGQTGADLGGLLAGRDLGIPTGGWAPRGWRTDAGPAPWLADFGLVEHESGGYPPRTEANARDSDCTVIFGRDDSPGCRLTRRLCERYGRLVLYIPWPMNFVPVLDRMRVGDQLARTFRAWLDQARGSLWPGEPNRLLVLNVAGNRERINPGIQEAVRGFLTAALR